MTEKNKPEQEKIFRVAWGSEDDVPVNYANHISVSFAGGTEFHLTFGHLSPPIALGIPGSDLPEQLTIKPIARIVTSPDVMRLFVKVLKDNMESFDKLTKEDKK